MSPEFRAFCRQHYGWLLLATFAVVATFLTACQTSTVRPTDTPQISGATFVGNNACLDCHTAIVHNFSGSPHSRLYVSDHSMKGEAGCESCHGPGSKHVQAGGGKGVFIVNPKTDPGACFNCHQETHAQFRLPHHHPVLEGDLNCVQCHDPHGSDIYKPAGGLAFARQDQSCAACHRDQSKPVVFVHEALREGCTTCHQPHGSVNDKLLVAPDNNLCLRCHAQIANPNAATGAVSIGVRNHTSFLSQGTCWSSGCHTAVHGSNVDPKLRY
jgi:predicted CXXCH cytochrome family protein